MIDYIIDYVNDAMSLSARRAWIEISRAANCQHRSQSLSARRAWIEIGVDFAEDWLNAVALRKESVDRNNTASASMRVSTTSLSARRAWIEMIDYIIDYVNDAVALRKESVDRNFGCGYPIKFFKRRSPQGERG